MASQSRPTAEGLVPRWDYAPIVSMRTEIEDNDEKVY